MAERAAPSALASRAPRGTIVAIQDADLELDPAQLAALVQPIVRGRRECRLRVALPRRHSAARRWMSIAGNRMLTGGDQLLYRSALTDMETCYKIMRADVARSLKLTANRFDIEPEITARLLRGGHRILELPVHFDAAVARCRARRSAGATASARYRCCSASASATKQIKAPTSRSPPRSCQCCGASTGSITRDTGTSTRSQNLIWPSVGMDARSSRRLASDAAMPTASR